MCHHQRKPLLVRERNQCLGLLLSCLLLPAELMERGGDAQGPSQAEGVRQLLGQSRAPRGFSSEAWSG